VLGAREHNYYYILCDFELWGGSRPVWETRCAHRDETVPGFYPPCRPSVRHRVAIHYGVSGGVEGSLSIGRRRGATERRPSPPPPPDRPSRPDARARPRRSV